MPDDAIGYAFNDKAATMSITVLNLTEASALLRTINKRDIKDVRAIDLDLALVLESGHKIIISRGAVAAVNSPQLMLEFADGDVALGDVFEKLNHIEVPADAAVTVTSKEITRYGIKRVVKPKVARNKQDQEADKDKTDEETAASPDTDEARPAETLAGNDGSRSSRSGDSGGSDLTARKFTSGKGSSSSLAIQDVADAPADIGSSKGGISWPVIAGGLGLLAAAGGGGGGGGAAASGAGSGSGAGIAATLSGAAALGPLNNATITAYDAEGRVIGKAVPVINGRYTLVLDQSGYKGLILLAIRDNTPGVADNYADEASVRMTDLGNTVLRAVALADGSNQVINVTALTELAALKAGLGTGQTNLAAAQVGATTVTGANAAVSNLFKVDILSGDVAPVTTTDAQGAAVINPAFLQSASVTARIKRHGPTRRSSSPTPTTAANRPKSRSACSPPTRLPSTWMPPPAACRATWCFRRRARSCWGACPSSLRQRHRRAIPRVPSNWCSTTSLPPATSSSATMICWCWMPPKFA